MNAPDLSIPIVAVRGSVRPGNYTAMALVIAELRSLPSVSVEVFDPAEMDLNDPGEERKSEDAKRLQEGRGRDGCHSVHTRVSRQLFQRHQACHREPGVSFCASQKAHRLTGRRGRPDWGHQVTGTSAGHLRTRRRRCSRALFQSPAVVTSSTKAVTVPTRTSKRLSEDWEPT